MGRYIRAIDQGTTSSRALLFDRDFRLTALAQEEFPQHYPASGWVEHDPEDIWRTTLQTARGAFANAGATAADIVAVGISNQRETSIVWERATGRAIYNAIVWQDRRTADVCHRLAAAGHQEAVIA
jgi:glycerol kinase